MRWLLLPLLALGPDMLALQHARANGASDGFTAYCTGNLDGTGQCVNQENAQRYTCLIIPGQVIDCKSKAGTPFQCVWISGVQSNQAEFWCDPTVDALLATELKTNVFHQKPQDQLMLKQQPLLEDAPGDSFGEVIGPDLGDPFKQTMP